MPTLRGFGDILFTTSPHIFNAFWSLYIVEHPAGVYIEQAYEEGLDMTEHIILGLEPFIETILAEGTSEE